MKPIWIIDDDQSIRWVLEKALQRHQLPVRTFGDVREVKEALTEDLPQVMVSDIRMPGGSSPNAGLELLHTVRREHPEVPVIIMTAYSDLESAVSAFQGGAFEYLPKPFDVDKAVELIDRHHRRCRDGGHDIDADEQRERDQPNTHLWVDSCDVLDEEAD